MSRYLPTSPGWYRNPDDPRSLRYWDGGSWAPRSRPRPPWSSRVELFELSDEDLDRSVEGPVHPHELREPVASGASSREWLSWRPRQVSPVWQRGAGPHPSRLARPPRTQPPAKLGPARRPLLALVCLVVIAVGVVVSSATFITPYETNSLVEASDQVAATRFAAAANNQCAATLPKYRAELAWGTNSAAIVVAARQVDLLRKRLASIGTAPGIGGPLQEWLARLQEFTAVQDRYASAVRPGVRHLTPAAQRGAARIRRQADDLADQADNFGGALDLTACRLAPGSA